MCPLQQPPHQMGVSPLLPVLHTMHRNNLAFLHSSCQVQANSSREHPQAQQQLAPQHAWVWHHHQQQQRLR
jgi:hypothetical protein